MQGTARAAAYRCAAWLLDVMLQGHRQSVHVLVAETHNVKDLGGAHCKQPPLRVSLAQPDNFLPY